MTSEAQLSSGDAMHRLIAELYLICRSITGDGVRETLRRIGEHIPLTIHEVPSGTPVFDWTVPNEWNIRDAYVKNAHGDRVIDFRRSNLHVLGYSIPVRTTMSLDDLRPHLYTLPEQPDLVPYRTSYYRETWGFCLSQRQFDALTPGEYEVCIDATLAPGALTYAECVLPGATTDEVLISCHVCHPSLANDNLAGIAVATHLAQWLGERTRRYTYRFLFIPGTIGAITWLARNEHNVARIKHGLVLVCLGDGGGLTYKQSRRGDAAIDRAAACVLRERGEPHRVEPFTPYGYDERQFCSPGFNLPVGCLSRTPYGQFPEYHTSADNLGFVQPWALEHSLTALQQIVDVLERNAMYQNLNPKCEPQLGRRGLYSSVGGQSDTKTYQLALLWVLNFSDGQHALLDIAERAGLPFGMLAAAADALENAGLLRRIEP